jgi:hypothetical protein
VDAGPDVQILPGGILNLSGTFTDAGVTDTHTARVDWGNGVISNSPGISITTNLGSGTFSGGQTFVTPGTYVVSTRIEDDDNGQGFDTLILTVTTPPVVTVGSDQTADEGDTVNLGTATFTDANAGQTHTAMIDWGDGTAAVAGTVDQAADSVSVGSHVYTDNGTFTVAVTVTDELGGTSSSTFDIVVANVTPTAGAGGPYTGPEGAITFAGTGTDPGSADVLTYEWDATYDGSTFTPGQSGINLTAPTFSYSDNGNFVVALRITDDDGGVSNFATSTVTVLNANPVVVAIDQSFQLVSAFAPTFSFTDAGSGDTHTGTIDWGDGSPVEVAVIDQGANTVSGSHTYVSSDSVTITVTVTDDDGGVGSASMTLSINAPPVLTPGANQTVDEGTSLQLSPFTFTDADSGSSHTATIDWGDGSLVEAATVDQSAGSATGTHTYADNGVFGISLTINDGQGGSDTATSTVTVLNVVPVVVAPDQTIQIGTTFTPSFAFTDAGSGDTHTGTIDWGDGSPIEAAVIVLFADTASGAHSYGLSATSTVFTFTVTATVTDDDGGIGTDSMILVINNPVEITSGINQSVLEGTVLGLSPFEFSDNDAGNTHVATIDWGDGTSPDAGVVNQSSDTVTGTHTYADDGSFVISLMVSDGAGSSDTATSSVTVLNVAPTVSAGSNISLTTGGSATIAASFTDPGSADTHTSTINWGDGSSTTGTLDQSALTVAGSHTYSNAGTFTVIVTVTDDDGGASSDTLSVTVTAPVTAPPPSTSPPPTTSPPPATTSPPSAPQVVTATPGDRQATVSWIAPASTGGSPITGYTIFTFIGGPTVTAGADATSVDVTGLTNGTSYYFNMKAANAIGTSATSGDTARVIPFGPPDAPTQVSATPGVDSIDVTWSPPENDGGKSITGYIVIAKSGSGESITAAIDADAGSVTLSGLIPGETYTITVAAANEAGTGPASSTISVEVPLPEPASDSANGQANNPGSTIGGKEIIASEEELDNTESAIQDALGLDIVVPEGPLELTVIDGVGGIAIPIEGASEGTAITGDLNVTFGALVLETTDGVGTATIELDSTLSVRGDARLEVTGAEVKVVISEPKLVFTPVAPDASTLSSGNADITEVRVSFEVDLALLPSGASLTVEYSQDGSAFSDSVGVTFRLEAENSTGTIENPAEDIAFVVKVTKTGISNDDLGTNQATLSVSLAWYEAKMSQEKAIVIVKQDDEGNAFHALAVCVVQGDIVHCTAEFTGDAGGFSTFGLVALKVTVEEQSAPEVTTIVPGPDLGPDPVITLDDQTPSLTPTPSPTFAPTATPQATPVPTEVPESAQASSPTPGPTVAPLPLPTPSTLADVVDGSSGFAWWWVVLGVLGLAVLPGVGGVLLRNRS